MDRITNLALIVRDEVADYIAPSPNATLYFLEDTKQHVYAAVSVPSRYEEHPRIIVMARIVGTHVVIEVDITDRPLYEQLLRAGIQRAQVVLAYEGESLTAA